MDDDTHDIFECAEDVDDIDEGPLVKRSNIAKSKVLKIQKYKRSQILNVKY